MSYDTIGKYTRGVWLIRAGDGQGAVVDRNHLPKEGTGFEYYWLGSNRNQANSRILDAVSKLKVNTAPGYSLDTGAAFSHGYVDLQHPGAGLAGLVEGLLHAGALAPALTPSGAALEGGAGAGAAAGAEGAAGAGLGGAVKKAVAGAAAATALGTTLNADFLKVLGSLTFWKGIGLVLAGAVILIFAGIEFKGMARV